MPDPIASTIQRARASYDRFLPSTGTVARTAATVPCRVSKASTEWRPQGLPRYMRVPEWDLRFAYNVDVKKGDIITVTGIGSFVVMMVAGPAATPGSYSVLTTTRCLESADANGNAISPIDTTDTVVFASDAGNRAKTVVAAAYVSQLTLEDVQLFGNDPGVKYKAIYDTTVHYGTDVTDVPDEGDLIYIPWLERRETASGAFDPSNPNATNKGIPIRRPLKESGIVSWMIATFNDAA